MKRITHLIFDLDGTLIDSSDGVVSAVNYSLEKVGEPLRNPDEIKSFIGYPLDEMYPCFTSYDVTTLKKHFQVKAAETVVASTHPLDGVVETISELYQSGYKLGIGTTKIKLHINKILSKLKWDELFSVTVGGDEVENVKPAPDVFQLALKRMKTESVNSIVIGDTINDIRAARKAMLPVIAVQSPYGGNEKLRDEKPDYYLTSIRELPALLENINNGSKI